MAKRIQKKHLRRGRPHRTLMPSAALIVGSSSSPSLPPATSAQPLSTLPISAKDVPSKRTRLKSGSLKSIVMKIIALRVRGMTNVQIAETLHYSPTTIDTYLYRAGKQGWLSEIVDDPKDAIEYDVMHKVVRNMGEALDSDDAERRDKMTVEVARGTIFKKFDPQTGQAAPTLTMLAVKIEMPVGALEKVRPGAIVGQPAYLDAEVVEK